jgi:hypothetical protein
LLGAVQASTGILNDAPVENWLSWLQILAVVDVVLVVLCFLLFEYVIEE